MIKPIISVIIPSYNSKNTIIRCIDSIEKGTFTNFEIIIVDDCSTDDTNTIIEDYVHNKYDNVFIILNEENQGPSFSRRNGIRASRGEYFAFVDSDDCVEKDYLSSLYEKITKESSDLAICNYYVVNKKGKKTPKKNINGYYPQEDNEKLLLPVDSFWVILSKRNLFDNIVFPDIRNGEDMAVIPQLLLAAKKVSYEEKPLYDYYYSPNSLSNSYSESKINSLVSSFEIISHKYKELFFDEVEFLGIRNLVYGAILAVFNKGYNKKQAAQIMKGFEKSFPNWNKNKYIKHLPFYKRVFVRASHKRWWILLKILCIFHSILESF